MEACCKQNTLTLTFQPPQCLSATLPLRGHIYWKRLMLPHFPLSAHYFPALPWKLISGGDHGNHWPPCFETPWPLISPSLFNSSSGQHLTANYSHFLAFLPHIGLPLARRGSGGSFSDFSVDFSFASPINAGVSSILSEPLLHLHTPPGGAHHTLV